MQPIPRIILSGQLRWRTLIPQQLIKINDDIKRPTRQDPIIDPLSGLLPAPTRVPTPQRRNCRTKRLQPRLLRIRHNLLERADELIADLLLRPRVHARRANVVDAFEDEDVFGAGTLEGVALVAGDEGGAEAVVEDAIAACSLVVDADVGEAVLLEAGDEEVGPAWGGVSDVM